MTSQAVIPARGERWTKPQARSVEAINALVSAPLLERRAWTWRWWWIAFAVSLALTIVMAVAGCWTLAEGIGVFGINTTVVWGFLIAN